ncbi:hypothetical protein PAHAL_4G044000 [Panicum hallii]|uniref:F-box/LRR-repeat protein 15-like leucin rich repeat domain-containing protein n=1 Tax=Panicum hallii TaxID=206008 RepID=A0A2S3HH32_9POAL|nr:uncharacterized protein LOC112888451 [Panicum hallii]PAN22769.1 hypothetical protein PAHAL_4G044000 [Panicum hallii]
MDKGKSVVAELAASLSDVRVTPRQNPKPKSFVPSASFYCFSKKAKPRKLVSLCLGTLGQHLEDIITDISEFAAYFPPHIKLAVLSIARRRRLLNDEVLTSLAECSWEILDISGSDVTDVGLATVANVCSNLRAIDISRCEKITTAGVSEIVCHCPSLEILRCGGCPRSEFTARRCLNILKPKLNTLEEDSWEELDTLDIGGGAESLRWLVWPKIDDNSKETLAAECPRVTINPQPSPYDLSRSKVPVEALASVPLDHFIVEDIDPKTWAVSAAPRRPVAPPNPNAPPEIPIAERFRLAYVEREARLAPKRAKRERQQRRRAERDYMMNDIDARSVALAAQASRNLRKS